MAGPADIDVSYFEQRLRQQRDYLRRRIREELRDSRRTDYDELAGRVRDPGEESAAELAITTNISMLTREQRELREVEAALARVRTGAYGRCLECARPLAPARLEAYPIAKRCIDCQQRSERQDRGYARSPSL